jgi:hypothetical protein
MTVKYIDDYNGVWAYHPENEPHPWRLLSRGFKHIAEDFLIGSWQNHESVKHLGPFKVIGFVEEFVFPRAYNPGDKVWIDQDWLYDGGIDSIRSYIGSPARNGGVVVRTDYDYDQTEVTVTIVVPNEHVTLQ